MSFRQRKVHSITKQERWRIRHEERRRCQLLPWGQPLFLETRS